MNIKRFFKFDTIKSRLIGLLNLIILLVILDIVVSLFVSGHMNDMLSSRLKISSLREDFGRLNHLEEKFIFNAPNDKEFYLPDTYSTMIDIRLNVKAITSQITVLSEDVFFSTPILASKIDSINRILQNNQESLNSLSTALKQKGFRNKGFAGKMQTALSAVRNLAVVPLSLDKLNEQYNTIIRNEKSFIESGEYLYFEDSKTAIEKSIRILQDKVENRTDFNDSLLQYISDKNIVAAIDSLRNYNRYFSQFVEINTRIGIRTNRGLYLRINQSNKELQLLAKGLYAEINRNIESHSTLSIILSVSLLLIFITVLIIIFLRIKNSIETPLTRFNSHIKELSLGNLPDAMQISATSEITQMTEAINMLSTKLKNTRHFADEVGRGNFEVEVDAFDNQGTLGRSLIQMRDELLKVAKEREVVETENEKRNWGTRGQAKFNDILRQNANDIEELAYSVIIGLIDYINANQGVIAIMNTDQDDDIHLQVVATYAYNRKKFTDKRINLGEGLVGMCAREKRTTLLKDLPEGHFEISTALGESQPRSLLVVPMKVNDDVFGVIELASYQYIEDYHVKFVEKIGEAVAAAISSLRINLRTSRLLEESKQQAEELASKEEEMRQNMEELQATQEEAARKEAMATGFVNSVNHTIIRADFNLDGAIEYANSKFLHLMGYNPNNVNGVHYSEFIDNKELAEFNENWRKLIDGGKHIESEMRYKTTTGYNWFLATYTSIRNAHGETVKILYLAIDIDGQKIKNIDYQNEIGAIEKAIIKAEYTLDGKILGFNDLFLNALNYKAEEVKNQNLFQFIDAKGLEKFQNQWKKLSDGFGFDGQVCYTASNDAKVWLQSVYSIVRDFDGEIVKITQISYDVTERIKMETEAKNRAEELANNQEQLHSSVKEMEKIQVELKRKEALMVGQLTAIDATNLMAGYSADGRFVKVNDNYCELFGYLPADIIGQHHRVLLFQEEKKSAEYELFWKNLCEGKMQESEYTRKTRDGKSLYIKAVYSPIKNELGKIESIIELALDITDSKLQEAELKGQLAVISKTSIMIEYSLDGTIIDVNDNFCALFDYKREEIISRNHRVIVTDDEKRSEDYREFWLNLRNGHLQEGEFARIRKDNATAYLKEVYYPMLDVNGQPYKILELAFDITQIKQQQEMLQVTVEESVNKEIAINDVNNQLKANDEKLRKNLEELEAANKKMKTDEEVMRQALKEATRKELEIKEKNEEIATSEEELRQNLEELKATQEAMLSKQAELEIINKKSKANTEVLKKAMLKNRENETKLKKDLKEKDNEIAELRKRLCE